MAWLELSMTRYTHAGLWTGLRNGANRKVAWRVIDTDSLKDSSTDHAEILQVAKFLFMTDTMKISKIINVSMLIS